MLPGEHAMNSCEEILCRAGRGIGGDRFFDFKTDYKGQITFFSAEIFDEMCDALGVHNRSASVLRRNAIVTGVELNSLIGQEFEIQGVRFYGTGECSPCHWMDYAFAPGAEAFLSDRGGLRARILTDGILRCSHEFHALNEPPLDKHSA